MAAGDRSVAFPAPRGDRGKGDDRCAERPIGNGGIVGDRGDTDGVDVGNAEGNQNWRHEGPGIAEAHEALEQRAEGPREQNCLDADVGCSLRKQPAAEIFEHAGQHERVEEHDSPERDPVDVPDAGSRTVHIGQDPVLQRHSPHQQCEQERDDGADQHREPCRDAKDREQDQQDDNRNQRHDPIKEQAPGGFENLREHVMGLSPSDAGVPAPAGLSPLGR